MNVKRCAYALVLLTACFMVHAQASPQKADPQPPSVEQQILDLERLWASAIQRQDATAMSNFLAEGYFLAIGVQGEPLKIIPRAAWLETLKVYETKSFTFDDAKVHVYGDTAVVVMLFTQQATVRGRDRSGTFYITDIWVKGKDGWRVAERHSSRPEPPMVSRP